jgi:hypothetical protein
MTCTIPQNSDFQIWFTPVTLDGSTLYFPTVSGWFFSLGSGLAPAQPLFRKSSFSHPADFTIDPTGHQVAVSITSSGFAASGGTYGRYFVALWAYTSGNYIGHAQQTILIQQQLNR